MMFVARFEDGSCGIVEAPNELEARRLLESDDAHFSSDDRIVSVRPLSSPFISRWFFDQVQSNELCEIDRLSGLLGPTVDEEIKENEYPMICVAHAHAEDEEPIVDPAHPELPLISQPHLRQMDKWDKNLKRRVRQAVELERERYSDKNKSTS